MFCIVLFSFKPISPNPTRDESATENMMGQVKYFCTTEVHILACIVLFRPEIKYRIMLL